MSRFFFPLLGAIILATTIIGCSTAVPAEVLPPKRPVISLPIPTPQQEKDATRLLGLAAVPELPAYIAPTVPVAPTPIVNVSTPPSTVVVEAAKPTVATFNLAVLAQDILGALVPTAVSLLMALLGLVKGPAGVLLRMWFTERKVRELVDYGLNMTLNAARDQILSIDVGNQVLASVLQRANELPRWVVKWMGGPEAIEAKAISMLNLTSEASSETITPAV